jgi:hypothetical protein
LNLIPLSLEGEGSGEGEKIGGKDHISSLVRREMNSPGYKLAPDTSGWLMDWEFEKTGFIH